MSRFFVTILAAVALGACHQPPSGDGQNAKQRAHARQTSEAAKKGALTEHLDPKKDLEQQERNLRRLRIDEAGAKKAGNHAAVWAVKWDLHRTEKLIEKDKRLIAEGARKKSVENPAAGRAEQRGRAP